MKRRLRWTNPFYAEHYSIETAMAVAECKEALRSSVVSRYSSKTWFSVRDDWPVFGAVTHNSFWMRRMHTLERSWFLQEASGVISANDHGSLVQFRIGMSQTNAAIQTAVLTFVLLAAAVLAVAVPQVLAPWPAVTWFLWPAAGVAVVGLDRLWWADDDLFLVEFISGAVRGTRVHPEPVAKGIAHTARLETPS
jgi:hypothetical protein